MSSTGEMLMIGSHTMQIIVTAAGSIIGFLVGLSCARELTGHLTLRDDPMGLIGTWVCLMALGSFLGGMLGHVTVQALGGRGTSLPPQAGSGSRGL
jgi:hypothetical protein